MNLKPVTATAILALCLMETPLACEVNTMAEIEVNDLVMEHGGWPISEEKCLLLKRYGLRLKVTGNATVLGNVSVGWVVVAVTNDYRVTSAISRQSTIVYPSIASMDVAKRAEYEALQNAIGHLNFELAVKEVKEQSTAACKKR